MDKIYIIVFISFLVLNFIFALYLVVTDKPKNILVSLTILYWFLVSSTFSSVFAWRLFPIWSRLKHGNIFFGWFLFLFVIVVYLSHQRKKKKINTLPYEKYLFLYLILAVVIYYLHSFILGNMSTGKAMYFIRIYLSALMIYIGVKSFLTIELLRSIMKAMIFMGLITSIFGIYQFFIDPKFFKMGHYHDAIPGYFRTSGIFRQPYDNGIFVMVAIFATYFLIKNRTIKYLLISIMFINLIMTFSRGLWLTFLFLIVFHAFYYHRKLFQKVFSLVIFVFFLVALTVGGVIVNSSIFSSGAFTERIFADTVTVRLAYYGYIFKTIPGSWLIGYGDIENNPVYFDGMVAMNQSLLWALGKMGGIHNLILEELFLRGIPSTIILIMFFFSFFKYSAKISIQRNNYIYCISSYFLMAFFFYFLSVSGFLISTSGFLCIFFAAITSGIHYNEIDMSSFVSSKKIEHISNNGIKMINNQKQDQVNKNV